MNYVHIKKEDVLPKQFEDPKQQILKEAKILLINKGHKGINMRELAKACKFAIGTIYNYFPTKEDIVSQLMVDYWDEYYLLVEEIDFQNKTLLEKLRKMYEQLEIFLNTFLETWVKINADRNYQHVNTGMKKREDFTEKLILKLEAILKKEDIFTSGRIANGLTAYELSKFIILNFFMMSQMKQFEYAVFEKILKSMLLKA